MARLADLSREDVETLAPQTIVSRGWVYFAEERVHSRVVLRDRIAASVVGSEKDYRTGVAEAPDGLMCRCDCPYEGPVCKHAIALLFDWIQRRNEYFDAEELAGELASLSELGRDRLFRELIWNDWSLIERASRAAGLSTVPGISPERDLAGLTCRNMKQGPLSFDEVGLLAQRIDSGLKMLDDGLGRHVPSAARALKRVVETGLHLWPEMDDPDSIFLQALGHAVDRLIGTLDWWPQEAGEGDALVGLFFEMALGEQPIQQPDHAAMLLALRRGTARGFWPCDWKALLSDRRGGPGGREACQALLCGYLDREGRLNEDGLRDVLHDLAGETQDWGMEWRRFLGRLAGEYWREPRVQYILAAEAERLA